MRQLLVILLLFSSSALPQDVLKEADKAYLKQDKPASPTILKSKKIAEPGTKTTQHQQTDLDFLRERAEVSTKTSIVVSEGGTFSCPDGNEPSCLGAGDVVCPGTAKCVDDRATCFDDYPCESSGGIVCQSQYDNVLKSYKDAVRQHDELASENVDLRVRRLEQKNCVLGASNLEEAQSCVR